MNESIQQYDFKVLNKYLLGINMKIFAFDDIMTYL